MPGIEVVEALKVNLMRVFLRRMDLRQHRKMIMIDNYIAYRRQHEYGRSSLLQTRCGRRAMD